MNWPMAAMAAVLLAPLAVEAAPLSVYGGLPAIEGLKISPDGKLLAITETDGENRLIVIRHVDSKDVLYRLQAGKLKVRDVAWGGDDHLVVTTSSTGYITNVFSARLENFVGVDFNLSSRTQKPLLAGFSFDGNLTLVESYPEIRTISGRPYAFVDGVQFGSGGGFLTLFKVDLTSDTAVVEAPGGGRVGGFAVGQTRVLAQQTWDPVSGLWTLSARDGDSWVPIHKETALDETPDLLGVGRKPDTVLVRFIRNHEPVLQELDLKGQPAGEPLPLPNADRLMRDPVSGQLIGLGHLVGDEVRYAFLDPKDQTVWNAIVAAYPGQNVQFADVDEARDLWVVLVDSPTDGPAYAIVDLKAKHASWIGSVYRGLRLGEAAPVQPIAYRAADGLPLSGYLTLPPGKAAKALPLVALVHGGPGVRDDPGFDWWSQALASRGYAVMRVNYRGSDGLGWPLLSAGFGQMGRKMQTDVSDGVRYLASQGIVDPARVCIVGASYGGYAALAGATLDTGVYRCAASVAGPSDLKRLLSWKGGRTDARGIVALDRYWQRYAGAIDSMDSVSPAFHADKVTIPILLVHGKDDTVVDYQQSRIMADALTKAGKPFQFVTLDGEDHWLSSGVTRLQMLQAVVDFLEKNNPPG